MTVYVFLAEGFEEIEAITPIDVLRRADIEVVTVGVTGPVVTGAHGIAVTADVNGDGFVLPQDAAMVVLPGGGAGVECLAASPEVKSALQDAAARGLYLAAICAAPTLLHRYGYLQGKKAAVFPTLREELTKSHVSSAAVVVDGQVITGRSAGVALPFAHALVAALAGTPKADAVLEKLYP